MIWLLHIVMVLMEKHLGCFDEEHTPCREDRYPIRHRVQGFGARCLSVLKKKNTERMMRMDNIFERIDLFYGRYYVEKMMILIEKLR